MLPLFGFPLVVNKREEISRFVLIPVLHEPQSAHEANIASPSPQNRGFRRCPTSSSFRKTWIVASLLIPFGITPIYEACSVAEPKKKAICVVHSHPHCARYLSALSLAESIGAKTRFLNQKCCGQEHGHSNGSTIRSTNRKDLSDRRVQAVSERLTSS